MRYLLTLMVVLALATPAMSTCTIYDQELEVESDCALDTSSNAYTIQDCTRFTWTFEFDRTSKTKGSTIICAIIRGSSVYSSYNSLAYTVSQHHSFGPFKGHIDPGATTNRLIITRNAPRGLNCGWFANIKLKAYDFME